MIKTKLLAALIATLMSSRVNAEVVAFFDSIEWGQAVGEFTTIDFTGFPEFTLITDQFADEGIVFTDGDDVTHVDPLIYPTDGAGLTGTGTDVNIAFDPPHAWFAIDHPGVLRVSLFRNGELIQTELFGGAGAGQFVGLVATDVRFDRVELDNPQVKGGVHVDNIHFGAAAPADVNADGSVDVDDLIQVILSWGACPMLPAGCSADTNSDGIVDVDDLVEVLQMWGD